MSITDLLGLKGVLELACYIIENSTVMTTQEQRRRLLSKIESDNDTEAYLEQPHSLPSPIIGYDDAMTVEELEESFKDAEEVKPDTLLPDSCGICGASFVDHGEKACTEDTCLYDMRNLPVDVKCDACESYPMIHTCLHEERNTLVTVEPVQMDSWVQCDTCELWRKIESTEGLPEKWYCSNIGKLCRPPQEAENHWPATRAKRFVVHFLNIKTRAPNHMKALSLLAEHKRITLKELYKMTPREYIGPNDKYDYLYKSLMCPANNSNPYPYYGYYCY